MTLLAVVLLWLAAGYRLYMLRRSGSAAINGNYAAAAIAIAAAFTIKAAEGAVDSLTGPYVSDLLEHGLVVVGGVAAQLFLLALKTGRPPRLAAAIRLAIAGVVLVGMIAMFVAAPIHARVVGDLDESFGAYGAVTLYRLLFNAYLTYVLLDNIRLCRRYASIPGDVGRTVSLTLVGWGSAVALFYTGSRILYIVVDRTIAQQPTVIRTIGSSAASIGLCFLAIGMLAPRVVPGLDSWVTAVREMSQLRPLWRDLTAAVPAVVLPTRLPLTRHRAELRCDRRFVEVAEALTQVHIRYDTVVTAGTDHTIADLADALRVSRATWSKSAGSMSAGPFAASLLPDATAPSVERAHLRELARAYRSATADTAALTGASS